MPNSFSTTSAIEPFRSLVLTEAEIDFASIVENVLIERHNEMCKSGKGVRPVVLMEIAAVVLAHLFDTVEAAANDLDLTQTTMTTQKKVVEIIDKRARELRSQGGI